MQQCRRSAAVPDNTNGTPNASAATTADDAAGQFIRRPARLAGLHSEAILSQNPILSIRKLRTSEDEPLQQELTELERADPYARDMILAGAIPYMAEDWARVDEALEDLAGPEPRGGTSGERWAYYIGLCVGLRLSGGAR